MGQTSSPPTHDDVAFDVPVVGPSRPSQGQLARASQLLQNNIGDCFVVALPEYGIFDDSSYVNMIILLY